MDTLPAELMQHRPAIVRETQFRFGVPAPLALIAAQMAQEKSGRVWGVVPKLIRMPRIDANGQPVFLDIRRWIPVGDVLELGQTHSAVPLPSWLSVGGPLAFLGEILSNRSMFTGRDIVLQSDGFGESAGKVANHFFKWAMPNLPLAGPGYVIPGIDSDKMQRYAWTGIMYAVNGRIDEFGREPSVAMAVASAFGVRLGAYAPGVLKRRAGLIYRFRYREIDRQIHAIGTQFVKRGITAAERNRRVERETGRKRQPIESYRER